MARSLLHGLRILTITKADVKVQKIAVVTYLKLTLIKKHHKQRHVLRRESYFLLPCKQHLTLMCEWPCPNDRFSERTRLRKEVTHGPPAWLRGPT
jgi:hypothetical protein